MNALKILLLSLFAVTFATACSDPLTKAEAKKAWPGTNSTLEGGRSTSGALTAADPLSIGVSTACPDDGTMKFSVSLSSFDTVGEFSFDVEFDDCGANNLVINGEIEYALGISTDANGSLFTWGWKGDLSYSGEVEGDCEYDMEGSLSVTTGGTGDPTSVSVQYGGTLCGYEADVLLNVTE